MSPVPLEIVADVECAVGGDHDPVRRIRGQVAVATTPGRVLSVQLIPEGPPACAAAVEAVRAADWVVLGPGSWFSSVLPHLLVPDLRRALVETSARRIVALNLAPQPGETEGLSPAAHLEVLARHAPDLRVDVVLADQQTETADCSLARAAESLGGRLVLARVAADDGSFRHDHDRLAQEYHRLMSMAAFEQAASDPTR
jgi:uncharacterized cofD-like protein